MEPLGKPSGVTLADHRDHVVSEAERLLGALPFLAQKYTALVPGTDLERRVRRAAWYHDWGKEHSDWQTACRRDYALYQDWRRSYSLDPDAVDADGWARYRREAKNAGPNLFKAGLRHEFDSLRRCDADPAIDLSLAERVAIAAHHGKLGARYVHRWQTDGRGAFRETWLGLELTEEEITCGFGRDLAAAARRRYEVAGIRALLRLADTRASRTEAGGALVPLARFAYTFNPAWTLRPVQELALRYADDPVTILRAPTGSGKSAAARLWGKHQIDCGRADRLVIAMPTRFTANALALNADDAPENTGLYHSSAWHARFGDAARGGQGYDLARERHALARLLATPYTVCTIDHLLIALTGTREDHHATFFFLSNAAVVFDEVDFYDPFVQANLTVLLAVLRALDVPVLLMSATVPESARDLYATETEVRQTNEQSSGVRRLHAHAPIEDPEDAEGMVDQMILAGTGIIYANTVERAYRMWQYVRDRAGDLPVYLYHSRYTEPDKKTIEEAVVRALGQEAWKSGTARGIVVFTQIGEMSINVSAPLMLSDLCPWDRLAQRAGRLARFEDFIPEGDIYVAVPHRQGTLYPAPYGSFDGPVQGWTAGEPLLATAERLDVLLSSGPLELTPERLVQEVNALYPDAEEPDARSRTNAETLRAMMRENWMIVPSTASDDDEARVPGRWKSRDIPPQATLLILEEADIPEDGQPLSFSSYQAFQGLISEKGIACPHYLLRRAVERGQVSLISYTIGHDPEEHHAYWYISGYEAPGKDGIAGGLGALSVRDSEDSFDRVSA
ncbi:MAG: CRISPR-associated helicase Cas3' [Bacteroidota bacterium]